MARQGDLVSYVLSVFRNAVAHNNLVGSRSAGKTCRSTSLISLKALRIKSNYFRCAGPRMGQALRRQGRAAKAVVFSQRAIAGETKLGQTRWRWALHWNIKKQEEGDATVFEGIKSWIRGTCHAPQILV